MTATQPVEAREFEFTQKDFNFLRQLANSRTGIVVSDDKFSMFYSRLSRRVRALGLTNFRSYCDYLRSPEGGSESNELVNAITTNLTAFFRENHHFEFVKNTALPEVLAKNSQKRTLHVWSAGCSTGEEPYSLAMTLSENIPALSTWDVRIHATDIDSNVLAQASRGVYKMSRVEGIDKQRLRRWFLKGKGAKLGQARMRGSIRQLIAFSQLNLMDQWTMPQVDMIFCRNVLIYFDKAAKERLVSRFADALPTGGFLFIGHSESLYKATDRFELVGNTIYRKIG